MRILMMAVNDPAGMAIAFATALNRHTQHTCRLVTLETRYNHGWKQDLHLPDLDPRDLCEVEHLLRTSDVFHFHMTADEDLPLGPFLPRDHMAGKLIVHHHHGHPDFRANPGKYRQKYRERRRDKIIVATPDLMRLCPEACWMPNFVPQDEPLLLPMGGKPRAPEQGPVLVAHSPTRKDLKNTDDLLRSMGELTAAGEPVRLDMIDDAPNAECLRRKRRSHIVFDHMQGYYGVSSLEALSQGIPTITGLDAWNREKITAFTGTDDLPWVFATPSSLTGVLRDLIHDPARRDEIGAKSRSFIEERWSDRIAAARLARFYES